MAHDNFNFVRSALLRTTSKGTVLLRTTWYRAAPFTKSEANSSSEAIVVNELKVVNVPR